MKDAGYYIRALNMQPHPEGGYFAETYRSAEHISHSALPERFSGDRSFGTAIYFLLESHNVSAFHRIDADEIWHFYAGGPLNIYMILPDSTLTVLRLGANMDQEESFQAVVPASCWFGAKPVDGTAFALVGCTVAPGFDFVGFEMADPTALLQTYPQHKAVIELLC